MLTILFNFRVGSLALLLLLLTSCTTVRVAKIQPEEETLWHYWLNPFNYWAAMTQSEPTVSDETADGIRYYLPKPYLLVTSNGAGGVNVETVFLPDRTQEYAIDVSVYFASQGFQATVNEGLLEKVTYKPDDSAVLSELVKSAGAVGQEVLTKRGEEAKASADEAKEEREEQESEQEELNDSLETAEAELAEAEFAKSEAERALGEFDELFPDIENENAEKKKERFDLEAKLRKAEFDVEQKKKEIELIQSKINRVDSALTDAPEDSIEEAISEAPGPVLLEIVDDADGLRLVPVEFSVNKGTFTTQPTLKTFRPVKKDVKKPTKKPLAIKLGPESVHPTDGSYNVEFQFDQPIDTGTYFVQIFLSDGSFVSILKGPLADQDYHTIAGDKLSIRLQTSAFEKGKYRLRFRHDGFSTVPEFEFDLL